MGFSIFVIHVVQNPTMKAEAAIEWGEDPSVQLHVGPETWELTWWDPC